jgi:hypothetical protein
MKSRAKDHSLRRQFDEKIAAVIQDAIQAGRRWDPVSLWSTSLTIAPVHRA